MFVFRIRNIFFCCFTLFVGILAYRHYQKKQAGPTIILTYHCHDSGFFYNIYQLQGALYLREKAREAGKNYQLVVLYNRGAYKEDRAAFTKNNPCYNPYDWFSYFFESINDTNKPLSYWHDWLADHPRAKPIMGQDFDRQLADDDVFIFNRDSSESFVAGRWPSRDLEFPRLWRDYIKVRPHIQKRVDDFKRKHDFAGHYVIGIHYRGTDKVADAAGNEDDPQHLPYAFCQALVEKAALMSPHPTDKVLVFVASDEQPFIDFMQRHSKFKVVAVPGALRSNISTSGMENDFSKCSFGDLKAPNSKRYHQLIKASIHRGMPGKSNYVKGYDVLIDAMLLGSADCLLRSRGSVSNQAFWILGGFEGGKICIDMVSEFDTYKKMSKSGKDWQTIYGKNIKKSLS